MMQLMKDRAEQLVAEALAAGVVITITQVSHPPFAMGRYTSKVEVRESISARKEREAREAAEKSNQLYVVLQETAPLLPSAHKQDNYKLPCPCTESMRKECAVCSGFGRQKFDIADTTGFEEGIVCGMSIKFT